jgi:riboflavin kinase/FMN adenylyltransferase
MKVIFGINKIKKLNDPVVALGVFDGLHRGHRKVLRAAVARARKNKVKSVVLTFWPHPQKQESLYSLEHRTRLIAELGIDVCVVVNFTKHFAKISAENFVENILVKRLGARFVFVGRDFRFGKNAAGDLLLLKSLGRIYNFKAEGFDIIKVNNRPITSTLIRMLIKAGKIKEAEELLGRSVSVLGTVIKGTALGRILGFPTANIDPHHEIIPACGIYAVRINYCGRILKGACYIGRRPTVEAKNKKINIEVHIFNFHKNIYGKYLEIQFQKLIRKDKKFSSLAILAAQIKKDIVSAKKVLF